MTPPNPKSGSEDGSLIPWRLNELERKCQALQNDITDLREKQYLMSEKQQDLRTRAQVFMWLVPVGISIGFLLMEMLGG